MRFATLQFCIVCLLCSCAHIYHAPSSDKVDRSTAQVKTSIKEAHDIATKTKATTKKAQEVADEVLVLGQAEKQKIDILEPKIPIELKSEFALIKADVINLQSKQDDVIKLLATNYNEQTSLETHLQETDNNVASLENDQLNYYDQAKKLATTATKQSTSLTWYRWHWWGSWIALGVGALLCIGFAILKVMGKIAI